MVIVELCRRKEQNHNEKAEAKFNPKVCNMLHGRSIPGAPNVRFVVNFLVLFDLLTSNSKT